jgi:uncharacterized protein (DUF1800 family)
MATFVSAWRAAWVGGLIAALAACGGGGGGSSSADGTAMALATSDKPASRDDAHRFLIQASMGPTEAEIDRVMALGYTGWIDDQFTQPAQLHRADWDAQNAAIKAANANNSAGTREVLDSFYRQAVQGRDQLRQRVAFALSQIFVVSMLDSGVGDNPRGVAGYLDMLGDKGFTSYRQLLEGVALHPMMGIYLTHIKNQKEDPATGRVPDENFAREVMQLFSIGLKQLNDDGSAKLTGGIASDTYTHDDIAGLAKVFTGWSWYGPDTADGRFWGWSSLQDPDRQWQPMQAYAKFHSTSAKNFLGQMVPGGGDAKADLKVALDTLASHPNVGPFLGRQLIQRLVTSNPSPAYVARVSAAFNGDMKALIKAVLLDTEARSTGNASSGKLREPVLRLTALLRAFGATSDTGLYLVGTTDDPGSQLGQSPLRAPSVFNFYRPLYVPPGTEAGALGLNVPEMQITNETTVAGYANYMVSGVRSGFGQNGLDYAATRRDVQLNLTAELALADKPAELVDRIAGRLMGGQASTALKADITAAVSAIALPAATASNQTTVDRARSNRVWAALFLGSVAPEFIVQP